MSCVPTGAQLLKNVPEALRDVPMTEGVTPREAAHDTDVYGCLACRHALRLLGEAQIDGVA